MRLFPFGIFFIALIPGCGDNGPPLVEVFGKVTLDNKPLAFKTIRFIPQPGTLGQGGGASTDGEGNYKIFAVRGGVTRDTTGLPTGSYKVVITEPIFPIETKMPEAKGDEPAPAIGIPQNTKAKKPIIPPLYSSPDSTKLEVTVPQQGGKLDLALVSGG